MLETLSNTLLYDASRQSNIRPRGNRGRRIILGVIVEPRQVFPPSHEDVSFLETPADHHILLPALAGVRRLPGPLALGSWYMTRKDARAEELPRNDDLGRGLEGNLRAFCHTDRDTLLGYARE